MEPAGAEPSRHAVTLDDLFAMSVLNSAQISPDGEWIAATVTRPVGPDEVYGRTFYEKDVTRADIWLISRSTGERRNLTQGAGKANGFWCASWSPDGRRLALLSTRAEAGEPRGGNNVRLYVWERSTQALRRLTTRGVMTEAGGTFTHNVRVDGPHGRPSRCSSDENAPFVWVDNHTLVALLLPDGMAPGIIDTYSRMFKETARSAVQLREGRTPTFSAVESGDSRAASPSAFVRRIDVERGVAEDVAEFPAFPFGSVQLALSPDGCFAALLTSVDAIEPQRDQPMPGSAAEWRTNNRLGFLDLKHGATLRWLPEMPEDGRYILDMISWSPSADAVAVRARSEPDMLAQGLFVVSAHNLRVQRVSPRYLSVSAPPASLERITPSNVLWTADGQLLVQAVPVDEEVAPVQRYIRAAVERLPPPRADWWLMGQGVDARNLTATFPVVPQQLQPAHLHGQFIGVAADRLWVLDVNKAALTAVGPTLPARARVVWPREEAVDYLRPRELLLSSATAGKRRTLLRIDLLGRYQTTSYDAPGDNAQFEAYAPSGSWIAMRDLSASGTFLWNVGREVSGATPLLELNEHMARIDWGRRDVIRYRGIEGDELLAGVIYPPDYQPGRRYPAVAWIYPRTLIHEDWGRGTADLYKPGQYNLQLYAARGYVVIVPSLPIRNIGNKSDQYIDIPKGLMPAVDRLVELGIADPDRLAVMGQSNGGFASYTVATYTQRFKAIVGMAGLSDLVSTYGQFDLTARGYEGLDHQKSLNAAILEDSGVFPGGTPTQELWLYLRNSPLYYADRIETPLLLIHGEQDIRGQMRQAEQLFFSLYRNSRPARLVRYWGEDHGLRLSPANVRSIFEEILSWFARNMPEPAT